MLVDAPGSGKTSFLKRLAFDFSRGSDAVFWHTGLGLELGSNRIASILDLIEGRVFVFVDNFADALNTISIILSNTDKRNILFVCAERDYRLPYIENAFTGEGYRSIKNQLGLSEAEADTLRKVHETEGISAIKSVNLHKYLGQVAGRPIAEANCRLQNNFRTMDSIVESLSRECSNEERSTFLTVSLARFCFSLGVRRSILSTTSHAESVEFLLSESAPLPLKYSDQQSAFLVPKQSVIGDRILEKFKKEGGKFLLGAFVELTKSVAPRVTIDAIRRKTPEAHLLGRLMDYDNNVKKYIDGFAEEFYTQLKPLCDWNARYWEQMSLLKLARFYANPSDTLLLDECIQHARSATSAERHPYSLTTLAKVLFQAMQSLPLRKDHYFDEAWAHVVEADNRESRWPSRGATLYVVCFGGVLRYLKMGGQLTGEQYEKLRDMVATTYELKIRDRNLKELRDTLSTNLR